MISQAWVNGLIESMTRVAVLENILIERGLITEEVFEAKVREMAAATFKTLWPDRPLR